MTAVDNAHVLVVGIANYAHVNKLPLSVLQDAKDISNLLIYPQHFGYRPTHVQLLVDDEATQTAIRHTLADLAQRSHPDATVFCYFSSHGGRLESGPYAGEYLLPVDTLYASDRSLAETGVSGAEFAGALHAIPAHRVAVVFDRVPCRAREIRGGPRPRRRGAADCRSGGAPRERDVGVMGVWGTAPVLT